MHIAHATSAEASNLFKLVGGSDGCGHGISLLSGALAMKASHLFKLIGGSDVQHHQSLGALQLEYKLLASNQVHLCEIGMTLPQ